MKKVISITLGGVVFAIEEDAHKALGEYLEGVKEHFASDVSGEEILKDIESGIAEKCISRKRSEKKAITHEDVKAIILELGSVDELGDVDTEGAENTTKQKYGKKKSKRLYRDADDVVIAGVASGIATYFDIDPVIVRVLFVLALFVNGIGFWVYAVLWIVLQKAETPSQKMAMKGKYVSIESLKAYIDDKVKDVPESTIGGLKNAISTAFKIVNMVLRGVIGIVSRFARVIGVVIMAVSGLALFLVTMALLMAFQLGFNVGMDPMTAQFVANNFGNGEFGLFVAAVYVVVLVPIIFLFMLGRYILSRKSKMLPVVAVTLLFVWMVSLSYVIANAAVKVGTLGSFIHTIRVESNENPNAHFYLNVTDEDNNQPLIDIEYGQAGLVVGPGAIPLPIPFGTDPRLVGGDALPTSGEENVVISAVGTEPFWSFEYSEGNIIWAMPSVDGIGEIVHTNHDVGFAKKSDAITLWELGEGTLNVDIIKEECSDGMSDREYAHVVHITRLGMEYSGCANIVK